MSDNNTIESKPSVKFSINAKGLWSGEVKIYDQDSKSCYDDSLNYALKMEELIKTKNNLNQ